MTRVTIHAVSVGRGRWSPLVITYDTARRKEQPTAIELRRGHVFEFNGARYRPEVKGRPLADGPASLSC